MFISVWWGFGYTALPFLAIFATGYLYVGFSSLHALWKMHLESQAEADAEESLPGDSATEPAA
jgi:hypothetical protein